MMPEGRVKVMIGEHLMGDWVRVVRGMTWWLISRIQTGALHLVGRTSMLVPATSAVKSPAGTALLNNSDQSPQSSFQPLKRNSKKTIIMNLQSEKRNLRHYCIKRTIKIELTTSRQSSQMRKLRNFSKRRRRSSVLAVAGICSLLGCRHLSTLRKSMSLSFLSRWAIYLIKTELKFIWIDSKMPGFFEKTKD